jgi:hypothetical protein
MPPLLRGERGELADRHAATPEGGEAKREVEQVR